MSKKSEITGPKNRPSPKCVGGAKLRGCFWAKMHENVEHHISNKLSSLNLQVSLNAHANVLIWIFYFCFSGNWFRFKALRSELFRFKFHSLGSKLQKSRNSTYLFFKYFIQFSDVISFILQSIIIRLDGSKKFIRKGIMSDRLSTLFSFFLRRSVSSFLNYWELWLTL